MPVGVSNSHVNADAVTRTYGEPTLIVEDRMAHSKKRLAAIKRLRSAGAPRWIIKHEQVCMIANRYGTNVSHPIFGDLWMEHVYPIMEKNDESVH